MIKLNKTIISVLVYAESTPDTIQLKHLYIFNYSDIVGHPEPEKKKMLAFLSTFWHPCSKCILMCSKKDRGGCQV